MDSNDDLQFQYFIETARGRARLDFETEWKNARERTRRREPYAIDPSLHIDTLGLTTRLHATLRDRGFVSIPMLQKMPDHLLIEVRGIGRAGLHEIREKVARWEQAEDKDRFAREVHRQKQERDAKRDAQREHVAREWAEKQVEELRQEAQKEEDHRRYLESRRWSSGEEMPGDTPELHGQYQFDWKELGVELEYTQYGDDETGRCMLVLPQFSLSAFGNTEEQAWERMKSDVTYRLENLERTGALERTLEVIGAIPLPE